MIISSAGRSAKGFWGCSASLFFGYRNNRRPADATVSGCSGGDKPGEARPWMSSKIDAGNPGAGIAGTPRAGRRIAVRTKSGG
jgi:hypothetical protein